MKLSRAMVAGSLLLSQLSGLLGQESKGTTHRDLSYATVGSRPLLLDLYLPSKRPSPAPLIVWIHGGGWLSGDKTFPYAPAVNQAGFAVASIDYRLAGEAPFPAQIYDCKAAVRWLRANATTYGYRSDKIFAVGASAGGHLAALLGTTPDDPQYEGNEGTTSVSSEVQAVCDFSGPSDLLTLDPSSNRSTDPRSPLVALLGGSVSSKESLARMASPALQVSAKACPFFIAHGDRDRFVPLSQSQELYDALQRNHIPSTLRIVTGGGHTFADLQIYAEAVAFLNKLANP